MRCLSKQLCILALSTLLSFAATAASAAPNWEATLQQAQAAYQQQKYQDAIQLFSQVAQMLIASKQIQKAQSILHNEAIVRISKLSDFEGAAKAYELAFSLPGKPDPAVQPNMLINLALCYGKLKMPSLKTQTIEKLLASNPKLPPADLLDMYASLGDAYKELELYNLAGINFLKANSLLEKTPNPAAQGKVLTALGLCQGYIGNYRLALENLEKASKMAVASGQAQTQVDSTSNLGILNMEMGDYDQALKLLNAALDLSKTNKLRRNEGVDKNNVGLTYRYMGKYPQAKEAIDESLAIAREVGNKRDEAIALENRAVIFRLIGRLSEARADSRSALTLWDSLGFQEGRASTLINIGKISQQEDRDLEAALISYKEALDIFTRLNLPHYKARVMIFIADLYKTSAAPMRKTRDLVFDDEPTKIKIDPAQAIQEAKRLNSEALAIAEKLGARGLIWSAQHGLGYCLFKEGRLEEALGYYAKAIDMVTKMNVSLSSVEQLGEYMAGREDLYTEAMEVCFALYQKTKDKKYSTLQMTYDETLRNEVQRASAALMQMKYEDPQKDTLYNKLQELGKQQEKARSTVPLIVAAPPAATQEEKSRAALKIDESSKQTANVQKLEQDYKKTLEEWTKKYPADKNVFDSSARVDQAEIQKSLKPDQAFIQYLPMTEKMLIVVITSSEIHPVTIDIPVSKINDSIKNDFLAKYIEGYGRGANSNDASEFKIVCDLLSTYADWFIRPIESFINGKRRLYIATNGFVSQIPFCALVVSTEKGTPTFLIENFEISYLRPSFIKGGGDVSTKKPSKDILAVGNPKNDYSGLGNLPGAEREVSSAVQSFKNRDWEIKKNGTEKWFSSKLREASYGIIYMATHGMPYSDVYISWYCNLENTIKDFSDRQKANIYKSREYHQGQLSSNSPLNGYLLLANTDFNDGLLTIKKILEFPDPTFENTRYVILSACNTGVTLAPKSFLSENKGKAEKIFKNNEVEKELRDLGWLPGVDQVSFVEPFIRRGVTNVYGTLWFAEDAASFYIGSNLIKNLSSQPTDKLDIVSAYSQVLRQYISESKTGRIPLNDSPYNAAPPLKHNQSLHPFFWAVGAIFGR